MAALILVISMCCQVVDLIVEERNVPVVLASHVNCEWDSLALDKVSDVQGILCVDPEGGLVQGVVLFLSQECNLS